MCQTIIKCAKLKAEIVTFTRGYLEKGIAMWSVRVEKVSGEKQLSQFILYLSILFDSY